ncbi:unnamed protein product [Dovyalis caffra]|uniref:BURP domain-containing protein n=1 Tax=Dovyalis caffra TaxID=77055 RepID=A0AAV1REG4_9ROSI|nr:unnamed protein product [Dovyalis caffra]
MELRVLMGFVLSFTLLELALTHAASSSEVYWQSKLPTTPMPKALHDLLPSEHRSDTSDGSRREKGRGIGFKDNAISVGLNIGGLGIDVGDDGVSVDFGHDDESPLSFDYGRSENQLASNPNAAHFFLGKDLQPGAKMNLRFTKTGAKAKFLPRQVAEVLPFSLDKFSEILDKFRVNPNSTKAKIIKASIEECEDQPLGEENKYCATSLEAMIDYIISKLGKNVRVIATEVDKDNTKQQEFKITGVRMVGDKIAACHAQNYMYPVFYCHEMHATRAYMVPLVGADGTKAKAVAVCHFDTSKWNKNHMAFRVVKVKPGTVPICHFLPEDHIVWVAS